MEECEASGEFVLTQMVRAPAPIFPHRRGDEWKTVAVCPPPYSLPGHIFSSLPVVVSICFLTCAIQNALTLPFPFTHTHTHTEDHKDVLQVAAAHPVQGYRLVLVSLSLPPSLLSLSSPELKSEPSALTGSKVWSCDLGLPLKP